jgi:menaquinone-9 beta-reductase
VVSTKLPAETDVVVIGGGPAGLAAALAARRRGFDVVVLDRSQPPIDKACGEGLMPDGIAALNEIGVDIDRGLGFPFRGIRFVGEGAVAEAPFVDGFGLGIRRPALHRVLAEHIDAAGVASCWQAHVEALDPAGVRANGQLVRCRWIVAADGFHSPVARRLGLHPVWTSRRRIGLRQHFRVRPWTDFVEVHWRAGCQAYVTPVSDDEVCVAVIGAAPRLRMADLPEWFPALAACLGDSPPIGDLRGAVSQSTRYSAVTDDRVALIGDASGSVDAVTGEGLALAFRHARALADALSSGDLARYEIAHRRMLRRPQLMARLLLLMDRNDGLRRRALTGLAARPQAFRRFLAVHTGARHPIEASLDAVRLGFRLLVPGGSPVTSAAGSIKAS